MTALGVGGLWDFETIPGLKSTAQFKLIPTKKRFKATAKNIRCFEEKLLQLRRKLLQITFDLTVVYKEV